MEKTFEKCQFDPDRAIETAADNLLVGRDEFAGYIARAMRGYKEPDGFVVGLTGPWGSGKSSVKNMVVEAVKKANPSHVVVEFEPWLTSTVEGLVHELFAVFADEMNTEKPEIAIWGLCATDHRPPDVNYLPW